MDTRSLRDAYCVDFLAGGSAGMLYHPLRRVADQMIAKQPIKPRELAKGLSATMLSSHQLVLMGVAMSTFDKVFPDEEKAAKAWMAGCVTTFTTTPLDVFLIQKGKGRKPFIDYGLKNVYRGFTPTLFRQGILGVGFYVFPEMVPTENKITANFAGGSAAALISHVFDVTRVKMQGDVHGVKFAGFTDAFWHTLTKESCQTMVQSLVARIGIVAVATLAMNVGKEAWGKCIDKFNEGEKS